MERTPNSQVGNEKARAALMRAPYPSLRSIFAAGVVVVGLPLTIGWIILLGYMAFSLVF